MTTIVWFRRDLRLHDHPALAEACARGAVIPVFIWTPDDEKECKGRARSNWWLGKSLQGFERTLEGKGIQLVVRKGRSVEVLASIARETGADAVYFNESDEPAVRLRDEETADLLAAAGLEACSFPGSMLFEPHVILTKKGEPYKVFTAYWKRGLEETVSAPYPAPASLQGIHRKMSSLQPEELGLCPGKAGMGLLEEAWEPGEDEGIRRWEHFMERNLYRYGSKRDFLAPVESSASELSPYIASGDLSVRALWHSARSAAEESPADSSSVHAFLRQLVWREFAHYSLYWFPGMLKTVMQPRFQAFPWLDTPGHLESWQQGKTGYPLVDAGMRQLEHTGFIHNRARLIAASFLVKDLLISWTEGAAWFERMLVDFDAANNAMGWQWAAGTGFDAAPYFRIFNPVTQSKKFDPAGAYIRQWLPELAGLPDLYIHEPWKAPGAVLQQAGVQLGETYPARLVDHAKARERALHVYHSLRRSDPGTD